jgi:hypothetical protein
METDICQQLDTLRELFITAAEAAERTQNLCARTGQVFLRKNAVVALIRARRCLVDAILELEVAVDACERTSEGISLVG